MSRPRTTSPKYQLHRPSGQARVRVNGKDIYLGPYNSPESRREHKRICAELEAQAAAPAAFSLTGSPTVNEVLAAFWVHAKRHYRHADGTLTSEIKWLVRSTELLLELYGHTAAAEFGPLSLKALQQQWVKRKLCRNSVNGQTNRVRRIFKWAASEELVPFSTYQALTTVAGLQANRTEARETKPRQGVPNLHAIVATAHAQPTIRAMILVERLTGMRPGELVNMKVGDVSRIGSPWVYTPGQHKTSYRGGKRSILIGPAAAEILGPYLAGRPDAAFVFSPKDARNERYAILRAGRKSKVQPSQVSRAKPRSEILREPGDRYTPASYAAAIRRACRAAGVPIWSPNQLRHSFATEVREIFGLEAAQVLLGHTKADVTQVYAERNMGLGAKAAQAIG